MDLLWSPWRYDYITGDVAKDTGESRGCVFCTILRSSADDKEKFILYRAEHNFVILNVYPYITGHLMVVPFEHLANLDDLSTSASNEMTELTKRSQGILREVYRPEGFNIGISFGNDAARCIASQPPSLSLPASACYSNFMTSIGQTRTIPEDLNVTFEKLVSRFQISSLQ